MSFYAPYESKKNATSFRKGGHAMTNNDKHAAALDEAIVASVEEQELEHLVDVLGSEEAQAAVREHHLAELVSVIN